MSGDLYPGAGAVSLWTSSPVITNCTFRKNESMFGGAIFCYLGSNPLIDNNVFEGNSSSYWGGAIMCWDDSHPQISYNLFHSNNAGGYGGTIELLANCSPNILGNTIVGNESWLSGAAFDMDSQCHPEVRNNIIWNNIADSGTTYNQVCIWGECQPEFYYSDIEGGEEAFIGWLGSVYYECIDEDPEFLDPESGDFHLTEDSPCIDMGDPEILDPDGTISDMGAYYFYWVGMEKMVTKEEDNLICYPNPVRGLSVVGYRLWVKEHCKLSLHDLGGRELKVLFEGTQPAGIHQIQVDLTFLQSGVYIVQLTTRKNTTSIKTIKL
jgi:hypothetical protein